ncbi:FliI/YscN family ATPase [Palleronia pelagia]|uniref:Flagellum-specific ATP synthase n=1 Tax=Palleronia pelagia TaxID=387096 RepID=A0A1H8L5G5_9RHOB|nr:FliI/YscN family ATPase [Palleronia pelagia]SEO00422.1 flagellum-specific ATP synthase [Palleronia pelagia]
MDQAGFENVAAALDEVRISRAVGRVTGLGGGLIQVGGLSRVARLGDRVTCRMAGGASLAGEVVGLERDAVSVLPDGGAAGCAIGDAALHGGAAKLAPGDHWMGRVIDPLGRPLDGRPLLPGRAPRLVEGPAPSPTQRRGLGARLSTGFCAFNTLLPIVRGQRMGVFAGAGVGKSTLLAGLARKVDADVVVIAMVGERGRELRDFVANVLGPEGLSRAVIVAATSDTAAALRRRCAPAAMAVAEHFRDAGKQVLLLCDSVTRFAEAHREIALAQGEPASLSGFPPSMVARITGLCERAGPGIDGTGDITAIFTVLVAGSDMDGPVADTLRGVLDGHVVLDRSIAERGRFPAVDLLRSVSRALPGAASEQENTLITEARRLIGAYERSEMMIQAGLYSTGSDRTVDAAIQAWPRLDAFLGKSEPRDIRDSFKGLARCLSGRNEPGDQTPA